MQGGVAEAVVDGHVACGGVAVVEGDSRRRLTITMRSSGGRSAHGLIAEVDGCSYTGSEGAVVRDGGYGSVDTSEKPRPTHPRNGAAISSNHESILGMK